MSRAYLKGSEGKERHEVTFVVKEIEQGFVSVALKTNAQEGELSEYKGKYVTMTNGQSLTVVVED